MKTKRMIYIHQDNVEFYDKLVSDKRASGFINEALETARLGGVEDLKTVEVEEGPVDGPEAAMGVHNAVEAMRIRDRERLAEYRKSKGLYDPTKVE